MKVPDHLKIFISGSFFSILGNLILGGVNYLTRRTMAVRLSEVEYGYFYGAFALVSIVLVFLDLGITDAGTVLISENPTKRKTIFFTMWKWKGAAGFFCSLVLLALSGVISHRFFGGGTLMMALLALYVAFQTLNGTFISYTFGRKQYKVKSLFQIIKALLLLILVWWLTDRYAGNGAAFGYLLATIVIEPFHIWWVLKNEQGAPAAVFDRELKRRVLTLMGAVATITFMQTLLFNMASVMLTVLKGPRSTAIYNIATPITQFLLSFLVFANVFLPLAVEMAGKREFGKLRKYTVGVTAACILMLPVIVFLINFRGEWLITVLFKSSYAKVAVKPLLLLMLGFLLYSLGAFVTQILIAMRKIKVLLWISSLTVLINLVLCFLFIRKLDVDGAALATLFSYASFALMTLAVFWFNTGKVREKGIR
jgi:O-antigen/teichoic acid export membrane protein